VNNFYLKTNMESRKVILLQCQHFFVKLIVEKQKDFIWKHLALTYYERIFNKNILTYNKKKIYQMILLQIIINIYKNNFNNYEIK
jgi:hypothetical protein